MGSGGIGGYYGARLARAGNEVVFVARGAHLEAIQATASRSTIVTARSGARSRAVRYPADAGGTFDLILFAVKTYDTAEAAEAIEPVVGPETCIVPIQNGVDSVEEIGAVVDPAPSARRVDAAQLDIIAPGVDPAARHEPLDHHRRAGGRRALRASSGSSRRSTGRHRQAVATDDAQQGLWEKFMFLAPCASINSATGLRPATREPAEGRETVLAMQREIRAVGLAAGVNLTDEVAERVKALYLGLSDGHTLSMQRDFAAGSGSSWSR